MKNELFRGKRSTEGIRVKEVLEGVKKVLEGVKEVMNLDDIILTTESVSNNASPHRFQPFANSFRDHVYVVGTSHTPN